MEDFQRSPSGVYTLEQGKINNRSRVMIDMSLNRVIGAALVWKRLDRKNIQQTTIVPVYDTPKQK